MTRSDSASARWMAERLSDGDGAAGLKRGSRPMHGGVEAHRVVVALGTKRTGNTVRVADMVGAGGRYAIEAARGTADHGRVGPRTRRRCDSMTGDLEGGFDAVRKLTQDRGVSTTCTINGTNGEDNEIENQAVGHDDRADGGRNRHDGAGAGHRELDDESIRQVLNTAVSYHYHANVRRKTAEGACFLDPQKPATMRCSWRWSNPGADAFRLRQKVKRDAVKWCKNAGGTACMEIYRNGKLSDEYDGLAPGQRQRLAAVLESIPSYDPEATALPEDLSIETGLYHERFAQMQGYW